MLLIVFMQTLYLIGTTHVKWPTVMKWMFRFCGIFAVDLEAILPLQCLFGLSAQQSKGLIQAIPIVWLVIGTLTTRLWTMFRETHFGPAMKRLIGVTMIGVVILNMTLVRASLEGIQCSPVYDDQEETAFVDWMCLERGSTGDMAIAFISWGSFILYGFGCPGALSEIARRSKDKIHAERVVEAADVSQSDPESQQSKVAALRLQATTIEPNPIKDAIRPFIATFTDQRWGWSIWLLGQMVLSSICVVLAGENIIMSQALLICAQVFFGLGALYESPYWQDFEGDQEGQTEISHIFALRPYQRLDAVLRGISIVTLVIGISLTGFIDSTSESRVALGFMGIVLPIAGVIYVIVMAFKSIKERDAKETAKVGVDHNEDATANVVRRKTEQVQDELIAERRQGDKEGGEIASVEQQNNPADKDTRE